MNGPDPCASRNGPPASPGRRALRGCALALVIAVAAMVVPAAPVAAQAGDSASADVLVFDASGSMWGQLEGGENKIVVAREVMTDYFKRRDATPPLAVIAYGHRRRGDCKDIEVIARSGRHDPARLSSQLAAITPRGMTPIAESLRLAAAQIPRTAERSNIILVTDGLETCDADPCAVAAELAASGHGIRAHVVGFGLTEKEAAGLSCVTEQTGGMLLRPQSGAELAAALDQIATAQPAPPAPPAMQDNFFDIGPKAETGHTYRIAYRGTARSSDFAGFTRRGEGPPPASASFGPIGGGTTADNPFSVRAPLEPGEYDLLLHAADGSGVVARQPIEVVPASNGFDPIGSVPPGKPFTFTWRGPDQVGERIVVARAGDPPGTYGDSWNNTLAKKGTMNLLAPVEPGKYELRYLSASGTEILFHRVFGVGVPHEDQDRTTRSQLAGRAAISTRGAPGQDALPQVSATFRIPANFPATPVWWSAVPLDPDASPDAWALPDVQVVGRGNFEPGRYEVKAVGPGEVEFRKVVEIKPGQANEFVLDLVAEPDGDAAPAPARQPAAAPPRGGGTAPPRGGTATTPAAAMQALGGIPVKATAVNRAQLDVLLSPPQED